MVPFKFYSDRLNRIAPYIAAGGTLFYFNPKTVYEGMTVALQPLGTEGQYLNDYPTSSRTADGSRAWSPPAACAGDG